MANFDDPLALPSIKNECQDSLESNEGEKYLASETLSSLWETADTKMVMDQVCDSQFTERDAFDSNESSSTVVCDPYKGILMTENNISDNGQVEKISEIDECEETPYGGGDKKERKKNGFAPHFVCSICNKIIKGRYPFKVHVSMHSGERPFSCSVCSKTFAKKQVLNEHMILHTGVRRFSCHICQKSFAKKGTLTKHLVVHTGSRAYSCDICDRKFSQRSGVMKHRLIHTGERPYVCTICGKAYTSRSTLNKHSSSHTNETPIPPS